MSYTKKLRRIIVILILLNSFQFLAYNLQSIILNTVAVPNEEMAVYIAKKFYSKLTGGDPSENRVFIAEYNSSTKCWKVYGLLGPTVWGEEIKINIGMRDGRIKNWTWKFFDIVFEENYQALRKRAFPNEKEYLEEYYKNWNLEWEDESILDEDEPTS